MTNDPGGRSRLWLDRFMRFSLVFGIVYALWIAFEIVQIVLGAEAATGPTILRTLVQAGTATCLIALPIVWRRERRAGGPG